MLCAVVKSITVVLCGFLLQKINFSLSGFIEQLRIDENDSASMHVLITIIYIIKPQKPL